MAEGGNLAEEVISTIRTAQAFGTQGVLGKLYGVYVEKSRKMDLKAAAWQGGGLSVFFFVIYAAYGLGLPAPSILSSVTDSHICFLFSVLLRNDFDSSRSRSARSYQCEKYIFIFFRSADAGIVVNVFLAIMIGSFSMALLAPEMQGTYVIP